jgi:F-box protein 11
MSTTPRDVLIEIVARQGEALLAAPMRCEGLLKDYCGEYRREIFVLISCLRVGLIDQMRRQGGPSIKLICARLALKLEQNLAISGDVAKWAIESWAIALGLLKAENATQPLSALFDSARARIDPNATQELPAIDYATETPPVPEASSAPPADEPPPEYLASEPEPRWAAPDWTQPPVTIEVFPEESGQKPGLRDAVSRAEDNACLVLKPGVYRESLVIKKNLQIRAGDGAGSVTFESLSSSAVVLDGACLFLSGLVVKGIAGKDKKAQAAVEVRSGQLVMEDCNLTSDAATVVEVKGAQSEVYLRRCHLHHGKAGGISFAEEGAGYLEECHLYQNKLSQVVIGKGCSPVLFGCKISHALMAGIYISEGGEGLIENCDIWGNAVGGVQCRRGGNPRVRHCRISGNERYGIMVGEQGEGFFEHCQIFENARMGVTISQQSAPRFASCRIFDNHGEGVEFSEQAQGEVLDSEIFANAEANVRVKDKSKPALYRCVLLDGHGEGLVVAGGSEGLFDACEISGNALAGVLLTDHANPVFQKCVLHHGMETGVTSMLQAQGQFVDCEITHHAGTAVQVREGAETRFERCYVRENRDMGVHVDNAAPVFQSCVIEENGGAGFACTQNGAPRMIEGEIAENSGGLAIGSQGKGRWEQVQIVANRGDAVLVAEGGRPSLYLCHVEGAEGAGLRFRAQGQGMIEDVDVVGCGGPGIEIETGANPSLKKVRVMQGLGAGIVVQADGGGTIDGCEVSGNAGGDWIVDDNARLVRM